MKPPRCFPWVARHLHTKPATRGGAVISGPRRRGAEPRRTQRPPPLYEKPASASGITRPPDSTMEHTRVGNVQLLTSLMVVLAAVHAATAGIGDQALLGNQAYGGSGDYGRDVFKPIHQQVAVLHNLGAGPKVQVVRVPVPQEVPVPVAELVGVPVPHPYPVYVQDVQRVEVPVTRTIHVPVEKPYPVEVEKKVPYPIEKPYHVEVEKPIEVPVPKPYAVKVPVYKHVYHIIRQKKTDD
ncbi:MAGE-like protein 2 [Schistocerca americana]|uniref:MAGE-like protein 2 n=1 Tax=Schistocerca americana TaxID=7009 RepID=UPI001F4F45A2|nr:MAGE-like protein 2 [Schistocerca americana]